MKCPVCAQPIKQNQIAEIVKIKMEHISKNELKQFLQKQLDELNN
ncbi:hypothetical protein LCGC14_1126860 [marine sediment metagenome]|uniref:Uncharacterized protein n=1 Tax=marine sediment metagenome TaxID=412755 RepID=A0A0F9Q827_9ZZZZ